MRTEQEKDDLICGSPIDMYALLERAEEDLLAVKTLCFDQTEKPVYTEADNLAWAIIEKMGWKPK